MASGGGAARVGAEKAGPASMGKNPAFPGVLYDSVQTDQRLTVWTVMLSAISSTTRGMAMLVATIRIISTAVSKSARLFDIITAPRRYRSCSTMRSCDAECIVV